MAFQPVFNQAAPSMIFDGLQMEARMGQRNKEINQQQLMQGMQAVGQVVGQAGQMYQENVAKQRNNLGKLEAYGALGMPPDQLDALSKIKDPDKLAGALAVADEAIKLQQRQGLIDHEYELRAGLAAAQQAQDRTGQVLNVPDPNNPGQSLPFIFGSDNNIVPLRQPKADGTAPKTINSDSGILQWDAGSGGYVPLVDPITGNAVQPVKKVPFNPYSQFDDAAPTEPDSRSDGSGRGGPVGIAVGQTATNPRTGKVMRWDGSAWRVVP